MLQVASFRLTSSLFGLLPSQVSEANTFLAKHKASNTSFNRDTLIVFYDDGSDPVAHQVADMKEYVRSMESAKFQQEVALHMLKREIADLKPGTQRWQELNSAINNTERAIEAQNDKVAFVEERIKELEA
jgi:vacuolar-type H+-ATPase subunit I/STV1